jgi:predicted ATPase
MKFHFENLGLLDQFDIALADLTLICGENNTGKTYATYAIYGFLRIWRDILHYELEPKIEKLLKEADRHQFNLEEMFAKDIDATLARMGKEYVTGLPRVFATSTSVFEKTICIPSTTQQIDYRQIAYQRQIKAGSGGAVVASIIKETGSPFLDVLVADSEVIQKGFGGLAGFIVDAIADIVYAPHIPRFHISSAERTGAAIFRKELDIARSRMLKAINEIDSKELSRNPLKIFQNMDTGYAWPVEDNVDFVRRVEDLDKLSGELAMAHPELLQAFDTLLGGSYKVVKDQLVFQAKGASKQRFTMNEASSCIRALLDVGFYLRCQAKAGDLFIIDEPELNLHPKNQRAFARLVARMVNLGIKVFITTHSDYLVKELNTLIMLYQKTDHTIAMQKKYNYDDVELIDPQRIQLYMTGILKASPDRKKERTLIPAKIYPDRGIEVETFDDTIEIMNTIQSEILFGGDL